VNGVDVREFTDEFTAQTKSQATVVSAILSIQKGTLMTLSAVTGKCHHGSGCQHPCHPRIRCTTRNKDVVFHLLHSQHLLHHCVHGGTTIWPQIKIA
jgi:hypothetical protein